ncbi:MAG: penicillin-binding protein activator LpoB [Bacteroidota bacterium]|nr:penicillin-binding protein activator LpoB [Bacteroidota bacterium]MDX5431200.1 penicillin-binding protein activator LpoB [Bacteroidota bacterium]MDX5469939.1 penicillin-binding protein activator LpoB [Bacteroidota bacterium]
MILFSATLVLGACTQRKVTRIDPDTQTDLSGRWNDTDNKIVAEDMIDQSIDQIWRTEFEAKNQRKPVVIVGLVKNNTTEFIDPIAVIKQIEMAYVNSGKVKVVATAEERKAIREEREDQQIFSSPETRKKWAKEKGADFMLNGVIQSDVDQYGNQKVVAYQVNFELIDIETNEKVWIGQSKIKKQIKN